MTLVKCLAAALVVSVMAVCLSGCGTNLVQPPGQTGLSFF